MTKQLIFVTDPRGAPREQFERTYVLIPPDMNATEVSLLVDLTWDAHRYTIGGSADDAGIGDLDVRRVIAIKPNDWSGDLQAFFETHYAGVDYWPLPYDNRYQLAGRLRAYALLAVGFELAYPTTRWPYRITGEFGVDRGSYNHMGLDLESSWDAWGNEVLSATDGTVVATGDHGGGFGEQIRVETFAPNGQRLLIRYAHLEEVGGIYVGVGDTVQVGQKIGRPNCSGTSTGDHLHIDVRDASSGVYADPAILMQWEQSVVTDFPRLGLHGYGGGDWLASQGVEGWCLEPVYMNEDHQTLDYRSLASRGIRVVVNLRRSWSTDCGGTGTIPPPDKWDRFVASAVTTICEAQGVYAFTLFNELNNPREWPSGYVVQPWVVPYLYNRIWDQVKDLDVLVGPGALDPFHGPGSDCREWFRCVMRDIHGAKVIGLHGYGRGPYTSMLNSSMMFGDDPLRWQYATFFGCVRTFVDEVPNRFAGVPIMITECNHLWLEAEYWPTNPTIGWNPDATNWIEAVYDTIKDKPQIKALMFYRWSDDAWRMRDKPNLLPKIAELNRV